MTKIIPVCSATEGSIHLKFAPELDYGAGIGAFSVVVHITPADRQPRVEIRLELPSGLFCFPDGSQVMITNLGPMANGQTKRVPFNLVSRSTRPANSVLLRVGTKQGGGSDNELIYGQVVLPIKPTWTTVGVVQATFLTT